MSVTNIFMPMLVYLCTHVIFVIFSFTIYNLKTLFIDYEQKLPNSLINPGFWTIKDYWI